MTRRTRLPVVAAITILVAGSLFAADGWLRGAGALPNVLVNNPAADTTEQDTQSRPPFRVAVPLRPPSSKSLPLSPVAPGIPDPLSRDSTEFHC